MKSFTKIFLMIFTIASFAFSQNAELISQQITIENAISELKRGDLLLIAGKGHEKFQSIMGKKFPFDDVKIAEKYLQKK